jgi:AraC-like DNA-binding protein
MAFIVASSLQTSATRLELGAEPILGKIADVLGRACLDRERSGAAARLSIASVAQGEGWAVEDVLCTYRPSDASFEERHEQYRVALVGAGNFRCRGPRGRELLTPGSLLLGNARECFECGHEHGAGDRCLAFAYAPEAFERLARDSGHRHQLRLGAIRVPPIRALAPLVADATAAWALQPAHVEAGVWEELSWRFAIAAVRFAAEPTAAPRSPPNAERGIARALRLIERDPGAPLQLDALAREAALSRYHFVRTFARVTGLTPHRYVMRARLRKAAVRLATTQARVIDVALDSGFRDISNFHHAYRAEFGATPLAHQARLRRRH